MGVGARVETREMRVETHVEILENVRGGSR